MRPLLALLLLMTPALAQQQADSATMQRAVTVLQQQRNQAMDSAASAEIRAAELSEQLAKAQARLKELEPKDASATSKP